MRVERNVGMVNASRRQEGLALVLPTLAGSFSILPHALVKSSLISYVLVNDLSTRSRTLTELIPSAQRAHRPSVLDSDFHVLVLEIGLNSVLDV